MPHLTLRRGLLSALLGVSSALGRAADPPTDPQLLKAAATLYAAAQVAEIAHDWCGQEAPSERTVMEREYAAWREASGLPGIEAYLQRTAAAQLPALRAAVDARREQLYTELSRASQDPAADCRNIRAHLSAQVNLSALYPQEYQLTQPLRTAAPAPASSAANGGAFLSTTRFDPISRTFVETLLGKAGGQPPYQGGGPLHPGTYRCVQQNTNDFDTLLSVVSYTLTLYGDHGLRFTDGSFTGEATRTPSPLENLQATSRYDAATGQLEVDADFANRDLESYLYGNDRYDGVDGDAPLFNVFRVLTDGQGRSLIYGQKAFGDRDGSLTVCRLEGPVQGSSPVAEAKRAAQAELERFNRYRLKPNAGPSLAQIQGLLHTYENTYEGINVTGRETTTLLLKDGTAYLNLRWSPHDLDVAASRKGEPQAWTTWRRQGERYELLQGGHWTPMNGTLGVPGNRREGLSGRYEFFSAYTSGTLMNGATATTRDVYTFTPGGQFTRSGSSGVAGTLNNGITMTTAAGSGPSSGDTGTYVFDGYTLEFRGPDGQTSRTYAFFWDAKHDALMIGGRTYTRK
ncbi:hypothetical protein [Deinococcus sonorensis]|uniref:Uncharacterized protein n=2 Tax=Deinococcus sonorensis TaxID=309891 RepID=A0AAU7U7E9_9DEIO